MAGIGVSGCAPILGRDGVKIKDNAVAKSKRRTGGFHGGRS
jgi:hypothetical protein